MIRSPRSAILGLFVLSFLAAVTACGKRVDSRDRTSAAPNASVSSTAVRGAVAAPVGELRHVDPRELFTAIRRLKRKGVVLNVWATWCAPCREELPMLAKVQKAYAARGVAVIPLSVDGPEGETKIADVLGGAGFEPPYYVVKPPIADMKLALYAGWPGNIPVTFLLDGNAERKYFFNAEVYENELVPKLDALLAGTLPVGESNFGVAPGEEI